MNEVGQEILDVRRRLALAESPVVQELKAADAADPVQRRRRYWRSIGELVKSPSFLQWAHDEFPQLEEELNRYREDGPSRRKFLQLMGASLALAGLGVAGCRRPETKIRPYNTKPVNTVIGRGMYYATTFVLGARAMGVLAETFEGRPTKIEGNPIHPNSLGGTDLFAQASLLNLYDPDRARTYRNPQGSITRQQFTAFLDNLGRDVKQQKGAGLAILLERTNSPAIEMVLEQARRALPQVNVYEYDPLLPNPRGPRAQYDFARAKVIVSLDADIFGQEDEGVLYRRQFVDGRRVDQTQAMNQLYVVEPGISQTGAIADHRLALRASDVPAFAAAILAAMQGKAPEGWNPRQTLWIKVLAETLTAAGRHGVVVAGERQGPETLAIAHEINRRLGSLGTLVRYVAASGHKTLADLVDAVQQKQVQTLVIVGGNPVYDAPADAHFAELIKQVPLAIRHGLYEDETAQHCQWMAPAAHYLESWGDAWASDGSLCAVQPMIEPLFDGISSLELLARLTAFGIADGYELVQMSFRRHAANGDLSAWPEYLQKGLVAGKKPATAPARIPSPGEIKRMPEDALELRFVPDPSVYDGRFANNAWLQECPDPITKLTWDNAAIVSEAMARRLGVETGDMLRIEVNGQALEIPAFVQPGLADNSITLPLGYGRTAGGVICKGSGFNTYQLRTSAAMTWALGAKVSKLGRRYPLATTQEHWAIDLDKHFLNTADEQAKERAIVREGSLAEFSQTPDFAQKMGEHAPIRLNVYTSPELAGANQWGMTIDLNACVGCNACVVACQAENNVPVVGKDEVIRGREMHWLRLDRYFSGESEDDLSVSVQPMACQHCENAPCEPVCPVNATVHSPEGLNEMVYNRCIGTRYCSNNCPYKVRRFNYFDWNKGTLRADPLPLRDGQIEPVPTKGWSKPQALQQPLQPTLAMAQNPNVTVRIRGVMEKCTYCVQRIESAKIDIRAKVGQGQANGQVNGEAAVAVEDGMVQTACQQVCPTRAITFGDVADKKSAVSQQLNSPRSYQVLEHLNVRPRTQYLARIRNLNPRLAQESGGKADA